MGGEHPPRGGYGLETGAISSRQFFFLIFNLVLGLALLVTGPVVEDARQDTWLAIAFAAAIDIFVAWMLWVLGLRFPGMTLIQYSLRVLGPVAGRLVGLAYLWLFIHAMALTARNGAEFINIFMPRTPVPVLMALGLAVCTYGAYLGLETVARSAEITGVIALISLIPLPVAVWGKMDLGHWLPALERGLGPPAFAALVPASWFGLCVVMGMLMAHHNRPRRTLLAKSSAVVAASMAIAGLLMASVAVLGPNLAARQVQPILTAVRQVEVWRFVEHIEAVVFSVVLASVFTTTAVLQQMAALGLAQWLGLREHRFLVPPLGLLVGALGAGLVDSHVSLLRFVRDAFPPYALFVEGGLTGLLLLVALVRGSREPPRRSAVSATHRAGGRAAPGRRGA